MLSPPAPLHPGGVAPWQVERGSDLVRDGHQGEGEHQQVQLALPGHRRGTQDQEREVKGLPFTAYFTDTTHYSPANMHYERYTSEDDRDTCTHIRIYHLLVICTHRWTHRQTHCHSCHAHTTPRSSPPSPPPLLPSASSILLSPHPFPPPTPLSPLPSLSPPSPLVVRDCPSVPKHQPPPPDGHTSAEQPARAVGSTQLPPTRRVQLLRGL